MTDRSLLERLHRIAPLESAKLNQNSWNCDKSCLTTEQKIFAISNGLVKSDIDEIRRIGRDDRRKKWKKVVKKCIEKCPWTIPWTMITISAIQLIFTAFNPSDSSYQLLAFSSQFKSEIWRFFTYSLLHANAVHLIINVVLQLFIALPLETEVGHFRTFCVYFCGVLSGSLVASVTNDAWLMVGASSGIYSLLMSHISHISMSFKTIKYRTQRIVCVGVLTISDIIHSFSHCVINNNEEPKIHIAAHIAGALSGIFLGFIFYRQNDERDFKTVRWTSIGIYMTFVVLVITKNVLFS